MPRIAVGSIFTECNHFGGSPLELVHFQERGEYATGDALLQIGKGAVGGALFAIRQEGATPVPLLVAAASPGGSLTDDCYATLSNTLLDHLSQSCPADPPPPGDEGSHAGSIDGVLLALHGSAAAASVGDLEGDLLRRVRAIVGPAIPIVATLDLHAHVTQEMVNNATALVAIETYPHLDAYETGIRATQLLLSIVAGRCHPRMAMAKVPVITSAIHGGTEGTGPFADVMRLTRRLEQQPGVLSTSAFLVHPYLDLPNMGSGGLVVTDGDVDRAIELASSIADLYWQRRQELEPITVSPEDAVEIGLKITGGPILLVETADCCGGGAAGDSVATLRALVDRCPDQSAIVTVVDPNAAELCHQAAEGADLDLQLGHGVDPKWGTPMKVRGTVCRLFDGKFMYHGGLFDGQRGEMGPSVVFRHGAIDVLISTHGTYEWNGEQLLAAGLDFRSVKFLVVKNPMNFNMSYAPDSKGIIILNTPGPTPPTVVGLPFKNLQRPWFPRDEREEPSQPVIYSS